MSKTCQNQLEEIIRKCLPWSRVRPGPKAGWMPREYICPHRGRVSRSHLVSPMIMRMMIMMTMINDDDYDDDDDVDDEDISSNGSPWLIG